MANVASNHHRTDPITSRPSMDRLTHAVIKETSKNLKYYIDIKRRENAFILNPNSIVWQSPPLRTKFAHGTTSDKTSKTILPKVPSKSKPMVNPEKQMCREELNFHMRSYSFYPKEPTKFSEVRLKPTNPPPSSSSLAAGSNSPTRDVRSRSAFKLTRHEQNQLIDDTADILASMIKSRRSVHDLHQTVPMYNSQNANPSPRTTEETVTDLRTLSMKTPRRDKRVFEDAFAKAMAIMQKSKLISKGFLCEYKISVFTGTCNGASTNASIHIKLHGRNGHTNFQDLTHSQTHHVPFLKGQTDVFILQSYHVGDLIGITIGHDRKDMRASWFLSKVSIEDQLRQRIYDIPCNAWLSIKSPDQRTSRDFPVLSTTPLQSKKEQAIFNETQSDYSTTITVRTARSITTNPSENDLLTEKKPRKQQQHVSIGPTIETFLNPNEFLSPSHQNLSSTSSDTELVGKISHPTPSTTTHTPSPTLNQVRLQSLAENEPLQTKATLDSFRRHSIDHNRPSARLEKRHSPDRTILPQDDDANNIFTFFQ